MTKILSQDWDKDFLEFFRWGNTKVGKEELGRLQDLYEKARSLDQPSKEIVDQINALEICNWRLEDSIIALCQSIGKNLPSKMKIGHHRSVTEERWKKIWAYFLSLRKWLQNGNMDVFSESLLKTCDPNQEILEHVTKLLRTRNTLKELYMTLLYLRIERLNCTSELDSTLRIAYKASITEIEKQIEDKVGNSEILTALSENNAAGRLQPCSHKVFRRYDIILSSIGDEEWRKSIPMVGTDGLKRADLLEKYLFPIESWIDSKNKPNNYNDEGQFEKIHDLLGYKNDLKIFLASLLVSLLRPQQIRAKKRAEKRIKMK